MKRHILPAIKLTILTIVFFSIIYPCTVWVIAQFSSGNGKGEMIEFNGKKYYSNIGQSFTDNKYFWSRPSAVGYNAAGSAGSNKGPSNEEYLAEVQARIDTFLVHNPGINKSEVPVELVTASGSGLDPDISVKAAKVQVKRIAGIRNLPEVQLFQLIDEQTESPLFGPQKINVLKLNIALDKIAKQISKIEGSFNIDHHILSNLDKRDVIFAEHDRTFSDKNSAVTAALAIGI